MPPEWLDSLETAVQESDNAYADRSSARGTQDVSESIVQVQDAATHAGSATSQVLAAAGELTANSHALSREVDGFLQGVRAA